MATPDTGAAALLELVPPLASEVAASRAGIPPGWTGTAVLVLVLVLRTAHAYWLAQPRGIAPRAQAGAAGGVTNPSLAGELQIRAENRTPAVRGELERAVAAAVDRELARRRAEAAPLPKVLG